MSNPRKQSAAAGADTLIDGFEAEGWAPEPGDEITGTVVGLSAGYSDYTQSSYPILTVAVTRERNLIDPDKVEEHDPPKEIAVHAFQAVLRNELLAQRPEPGETVTIACGGKRAHRKAAGQTVMLYKVQVHREGVQAGTWSDLFGPPPGQQMAAAAAAGVDPATGEVAGGFAERDGADHPFGD